MKSICLDITRCGAIGDTISATPLIRKLYNSYGKKLSVISNHPELFINSPYIENNFQFTRDTYEHVKENYQVFTTFDTSQRENGVSNKHNTIDIRQFHAISFGFMLTKEELQLDYFPSGSLDIEVPDKYVLIHPVQNWPSRTWDLNNWKLLTELLNENGIAVISIGRDSSELGTFNTQKPVFNFEIKYGINLLNKTNIEQTWHLISKSSCFITMDSGLLHLAGTTDANIIQLGSSINPELRAPYRKGSQSYKYHYIQGECGLHCASDVKYGVREHGTVLGVPPLVRCLEGKEKFECHPTILDVAKKVLDII
jgi:ADP-heptose:LPS heptosyltransferase